MTTVLSFAVVLCFCGVLIHATISDEDHRDDHSHVAWNFIVHGRRAFQVNAIIYNANSTETAAQRATVPKGSSCDIHKATHNDYAWNFMLDGFKGLEFKGLLDNQTIATVDFDDETDISFTLPSDSGITNTGPHCSKYKPVSGIYWREWVGSIPHDAISGGYSVKEDGQKDPVYLAQGYLDQKNAGIIPTALYSNANFISLPFEGVHNVSKQIKVLCGNQDDVTWISWRNASHLNPEMDYVNAGFERTFPLYFGRSRHNSQWVFGKVVLRDNGTYFAYENTEYYIGSFDVLCYRQALTIDQFVKN